MPIQTVLKIYTDGSKDPQNNTNGCAFVIPELKVSYILSGM
jgi:ribonuclease HI